MKFVVQEPQLGTGHALLQALPELGGATGDILLLYGDVPFLSAATWPSCWPAIGTTGPLQLC